MDSAESNKHVNRKAAVSGIFFVIAQVLVRGVSFLTTPLYTRLVSTAQYGVIHVYESWLVILVPIMSLCLSRSVFRAKFDFEDRYDEYVSSVLSLSFLSSLGMFLIVSVVCREWFM
ncbi:MAG: oligosaccharide flippase family protein, partial [Erysipelotrichales bacterium]|nr:oligosaccharide flippase family protein [Erysipelotrichales bacterium]